MARVNPTHLRLAKTAQRLIKTHGRSASLIMPAQAATPDPFNPFAATTETPETLVADVIVVLTNYESSEVDGVQIQAQDRQALLAGNVAPNAAMRLRLDDVNYSIVSVNSVKPADTTMLHKLQLRL